MSLISRVNSLLGLDGRGDVRIYCLRGSETFPEGHKFHLCEMEVRVRKFPVRSEESRELWSTNRKTYFERYRIPLGEISWIPALFSIEAGVGTSLFLMLDYRGTKTYEFSSINDDMKNVPDSRSVADADLSDPFVAHLRMIGGEATSGVRWLSPRFGGTSDPCIVTPYTLDPKKEVEIVMKSYNIIAESQQGQFSLRCWF